MRVLATCPISLLAPVLIQAVTAANEFPVGCDLPAPARGIEIISVEFDWQGPKAPRATGRGAVSIWLGLNLLDPYSGDLIQTLAEQRVGAPCKKKEDEWYNDQAAVFFANTRCVETSVYHPSRTPAAGSSIFGSGEWQENGKGFAWDGRPLKVAYHKNSAKGVWEQIIKDCKTGAQLGYLSSPLSKANDKMVRISTAVETLDGWHPTVLAHQYKNVRIVLSGADPAYGSRRSGHRCAFQGMTSQDGKGREWLIQAILMQRAN